MRTRLWILIFIVCLVNINKTSAQIVKPLGDGVPNYVLAHCFNNGSLYVMYYSGSSGYILSRWNGVFWAKLDSIKVADQFNAGGPGSAIKAITFYNNELYVAGTFDSIVKVSGSRHILKWNTKSWTGIGGRRFMSDSSGVTKITSLITYQNELIAGGVFDSIANLKVSNMAAWDGTKWSYVGDSQNNGVDTIIGSNIVNGMIVYKDTLYVYGTFNICGGKPTHNIGRWDGKNWTGNYMDINVSSNTIYSIAYFNNELYATGLDSSKLTGRIYKTTGTGNKWIDVSPQHIELTVYTLCVNAHKLWVTGDFFNAPNEAINASFDGTNWKFYYNSPFVINGRPTYLDTSKGKLYMIGDFKTKLINNANAGIIDTNALIVIGNAYHDLNTNCHFDVTDSELGNRLITAWPGPYCAQTDSKGRYILYLPPNTYKIQFTPQKNWKQTCPVTPAYYNLKCLADSTYPGNDFASDPIPNVKDIDINIVSVSGGFSAKSGVIEHYRIYFKNDGTIDIPAGKFYLDYPANFSKFKATPVQDSTYSNGAAWHFVNLKTGESRYIDFDLRIDTLKKIGQAIQFFAGFDSISSINDIDLKNNFDTLTQTIVAAHDPNFKQSFPSGDITSATNRINYVIHFQNVGDTTASKVYVIDTLDLALPLTEVRLGSVSHTDSFSNDNNVLMWTFNNINLPDSTKDPIKSQGFINFSAGIKQGVGTGKVISNIAYIYFDYEQPVVTNKTANKIVYKSTGIEQEYFINGNLKVYPNPANQQLNIENPGNADLMIIIYNTIGQPIKMLKLEAFKNASVDVSNFHTGTYFIKSNSYKVFPVIVSH